MQQLLAIEWLKIKKYRTFWILTGFFLVLLPLWNYQVQSGMIKLGGPQKGGINFLSTAYSFPGVWGNVGFWGSIFVLFLSILIIILTTNEYNFKTNRQNVIDGWSRMQFFHAKVWFVVLLSVLATVYLFLMGLIFGVSNSGSFMGAFDSIDQVLYFFLLCLDYLGFALFISIWIRRSGLAIGIFLLYSFILENILRGLLNWQLPKPIGNFLMLQSSDELLPFPMLRTLANATSAGDSIPDWAYVVTTVGWCLVYYFISKRMLEKRDW